MDQSFLQSAPMQFTDVSTATQPNPSGPAQSKGGGLMGSIIHGLTQAPDYFLKADIQDPAKELAAQVTGNKAAFNNAIKTSQQNLVGGNKVSSSLATNAKNVGKQVAGNIAQLAASTLMPEGAGLAGKAIMGARAGALGGAGSALTNNQNVLKGALTGAAAGGVIAPVAPAVLGGAAKVLGLGGKAATTAADDTAGNSGGTINKVINNLANKQTAKDTTMQAAQDSQPYAEAGVGKNDLQSARINDTAQGKGLFSTLRNVNMGTTPDQMQAYHDAWTGANGAGSGAMNQILAGAGNVKPGNLLGVAEKALSTENTSLGSASQPNTAANGLLQDITNTMKDTGLISQHTASGKGSDTVQGVLNQEQLKSADTSATTAFKTLQNLETLSRQQTDPAAKRVLSTVQKSLGDALWNDSGVNKAVANFKLAPDDANAIDSKVAQSGGSPELAQNIKDTINNAQTGPELRAAQEPGVRAGQLSDAYNKASGGALTAMPKGGGMNAGTVLGAEAVGHAIIHPATGIPMLASLGGKKLLGSAEGMIGKGAQAIQGSAAPSATAAADTTGAAASSATSTLDPATVDSFQKAGAQVADNGDGTVTVHLPDTATNTGRSMTGKVDDFNNIKGGTPQPQAQPPLSKVAQTTLAAPRNIASTLQNLSGRGGVLGAGTQGALQGAQSGGAGSLQGAALASNTALASSGSQLSLGGQTLGGQQSQTPTSEYPEQNMLEDIQRDPSKASTYEDLYKLMNPNYQLTTDQSNDVVANQKANDALQTYMQELGGAKGGTGPVEGVLSNLLGNNILSHDSAATQAKALETKRVDVASTIAATLSPTGRPAVSVVKQIEDSLPSIMDSNAVATQKYSNLMAGIQSGQYSSDTSVNQLTGGM